MKQRDYVFTIGFDGDKALVDKQSSILYRKLNSRTLADRGLFKEACRLALYDGDQESQHYILEKFNAATPFPYETPGEMIRIFGIQAPDNISKTQTI